MKGFRLITSRFTDQTYALYPSDKIYSGVLGTSEQQVTVPSGASFVMFVAEGNFYVNYDTTAAVPSGSISEAGGELNPFIRSIDEVTTLHLIAPSSIRISLVFYDKSSE